MGIAIAIPIVATSNAAIAPIDTERCLSEAPIVIGRITRQAAFVDTLVKAWFSTVEVLGASHTVKAIAGHNTDRRITTAALVATDDTADTLACRTLTGIGIITIVTIKTRDTALAVITEWRIPTAARAIVGITGLAASSDTLRGIASAIAITHAANTLIAIVTDNTEWRVPTTTGIVCGIAGHTGLSDTLVSITIGIV